MGLRKEGSTPSLCLITAAALMPTDNFRKPERDVSYGHSVVNSNYNLPPKQRRTQQLVTQFNAAEELWLTSKGKRRRRRIIFLLLNGISEAEVSMKIKYSRDADVLIIKLREGKPSDSRDIAEGIIVHLTARGQPLEIEILDASKVVQKKDIEVSLGGLFP